ncbi:LPS-assembly protein LptD [Allohahella marinimesophila]
MPHAVRRVSSSVLISSMLSTAAACALLSPLAQAETEAERQTIAELDWVPRESFDKRLRDSIEPYCEGTYLVPQYGFDMTLETPSGAAGSRLADLVKARAGEVSADSGSYVRFKDGVEVQQGEWWVEAENAEMDRATDVMTAYGGMIARGPRIGFSGGFMRYNFKSSLIEIENADYVLYERHARGEATSIRSEGSDVIYATDSSFTTCSPGNTSWSLMARSLELNRKEGEGVARNATLRVADVPILYLPYFAFPLDDSRRSGFLFPFIGSSNAGSGISIGAPYYFNLAPNYDLTYTPQYIHRRGILNELEGRYLDPRSEAVFRAGYIANDESFAESNPDKGSGRRFGVDFEQRYLVDRQWYALLDYNYVSDLRYIDDLNRTLQIQSETHIRRTIDVKYAGEDMELRTRFLGYQTVDPNIARVDRPYLLLPQIYLDYDINDELFRYQITSEYSYFWRRDDEIEDPARRVKGSRWRTQPSLSFPFSRTWGYFTPKLKLDHTDYILQDRLPGEETHVSRTVPFFSVDSGIYLDRKLELFDRLYNQSLEPRIFYVASAQQNQQDIPNFDTSVATFSFSQLYNEDRFFGGDRVGDNNRLTLGFTTRFNEYISGWERLRLSLGQIFHFSDRDVGFRDPQGNELSPGTEFDGISDDSKSAFAGELAWSPNRRMDIRVDGLWDPDTGETELGGTSVSYHDEDYRTIVNLTHRYSIDNLEQADVSTILPVSDTTSFIGRWLYDLNTKRTLATIYGLEYTDCCWRVQAMVRSILEDDSKIDHGFILRFELRGLGEIGTGVTSALEQEIRNMRERDNYRQTRYNW